MNVYQLEYKYRSVLTGLEKRRSFFYRPEYIADNTLWRAVRTGNEIINVTDE